MSDEIIISRSTSQQKQQTTFATEVIDLPSGGKYYPPSDPLSKGHVEMKHMTAKEEDILTSPNLLKKGIAIEKLLESLIVDKNIDVNKLLSGDKNALIFACRRLAYGDNYGPVEVSCTKCSNKSRVNIDLGQLNNKQIEESLISGENGEFNYTLPHSKSVITFRLLTSGDEKLIEKEIQSMSKIKKDVSSEITTRLKNMVTSVNGETDKARIKEFIDNMLSKDALSLRQYIKSITPDIDSTFNFTCESCGNEERLGVPVTAQFFWPDSGL